MRIETSKGVVHLRFRHLCEEPAGFGPWRQGTKVAIYNDGGTGMVLSATVWCHVNDQFSRYEGRRQALTKLLKGADKDFRAQVWHAYWCKTNQAERGYNALDKYASRALRRGVKAAKVISLIAGSVWREPFDMGEVARRAYA